MFICDDHTKIRILAWGDRVNIMPAMHILRFALVLVAAASLCLPMQGQDVWQMQESGTTAGLRGIDSVDGTVAWASGTGGTVLKTVDGGAHWTACAVPDGDKDGGTLDFRGVQAFNANAAIIMSSGKGKLSRLYKTTNGCKSWKLIFVNPDKEGFWDAISFQLRHEEPEGRKIPEWMDGWLLGDPVDGRFSLFRTINSGKDWNRHKNSGLGADPSKQGVFAASNSSLIAADGMPAFGSGGLEGAFIRLETQIAACIDDCSPADMNVDGKRDKWLQEPVPLGNGTESSGIFSIASRFQSRSPYIYGDALVAVGGNYTKPNESGVTAARSGDGGRTWVASIIPPHGYRSTVQWGESIKVWVTAGTNGSDFSSDDGKTWKPLDDGNWNALSLPFVVGPKGRIGRLNAAAIPKP
jgi:hypothetical protein